MPDSVSATAEIPATPEAVFAVLADPATHEEIDGTGNVRATGPREPLAAAGQVFRMPMFHPNHPDRNYETANLVDVFDPPRAIGWKTGYDKGDGELGFGGWRWQYDLVPTDAGTSVTLTYDWSATDEDTRRRIGFPPFPPEHFRNSLTHLASLVARA